MQITYRFGRSAPKCNILLYLSHNFYRFAPSARAILLQVQFHCSPKTLRHRSARTPDGVVGYMDYGHVVVFSAVSETCSQQLNAVLAREQHLVAPFVSRIIGFDIGTMIASTCL